MQRLSLFLAIALCVAQLSRARGETLVFTHVTVIDVTGAPAKADVSVIITGDRISGIGKTGKIHPPKQARIVDASGKFLIPGLWDMHTHLNVKEFLPLFLVNGITGVRVMWGLPDQHVWRKAIETGALAGPRLVIASTLVDGPAPYWLGSLSVSNDGEARHAVALAKQDGADFVKVYQFLPRELFFAIADEANKQGIAFGGHVPLSVSAEEASNAGQKSFEHLVGILPACSTLSAELLKAQQDDLADGIAAGRVLMLGKHVKQMRRTMLDTYSSQKAASLFALLKANATWQCPTLTLLRMFADGDDANFRNDARLKYIPRSMKASWNPSRIDGIRTAEDFAFSKLEFQKDLEVVGAMQRAGVGILAGTDTPNPFCFPGSGLHDELALLVRAGLTPVEALRAATLNPARFLGREKDLGTIEAGKIADLVLLDANPLDDIANTRRIASVVYAGHLMTRSELDQTLARSEALANRQGISQVLFKTIQEKDAAAAVKQYHEIAATEPDAYEIGENELIGLGYRLIAMKRYKDAIEIFKLSVESYPQSYNTYDSLAEAYMDAGEKELAIENYKKSLQLRPDSQNGIRMLKKLGVP